MPLSFWPQVYCGVCDYTNSMYYALLRSRMVLGLNRTLNEMQITFTEFNVREDIINPTFSFLNREQQAKLEQCPVF